MSSTESEFGYGRHGSNRVHFKPSPEHIRATAQEIRELGFVDAAGVWNPPWSAADFRERVTGRLVTPRGDLAERTEE